MVLIVIYILQHFLYSSQHDAYLHDFTEVKEKVCFEEIRKWRNQKKMEC